MARDACRRAGPWIRECDEPGESPPVLVGVLLARQHARLTYFGFGDLSTAPFPGAFFEAFRALRSTFTAEAG